MKPGETTGLAMVLRVGTGFVISTFVYLLFESPRLRRLPRRVRWPLTTILSTAGLVTSMLLLMAGAMGGPTEWNPETTLWALMPRVIAAGFWCASSPNGHRLDAPDAAAMRLRDILGGTAR